MSTSVAVADERRQHHALRRVFVQCCVYLAPIVVANAKVATVSNFAISHMLIAEFPDLSATEAQIVIMTVERLHRQQQLDDILQSVQNV